MAVRLEAGAGTVHWGYLDAALAPALSIDSGDTVTISTVSGPPDMLPPPPASVPQALYDIHNARTRRVVPGHMCTGPVAVRGARPGQVLQVDIETSRSITIGATPRSGRSRAPCPMIFPSRG
jgi:acetamidase/formamidase